MRNGKQNSNSNRKGWQQTTDGMHHRDVLAEASGDAVNVTSIVT